MTKIIVNPTHVPDNHCHPVQYTFFLTLCRSYFALLDRVPLHVHVVVVTPVATVLLPGLASVLRVPLLVLCLGV